MKKTAHPVAAPGDAESRAASRTEGRPRVGTEGKTVDESRVVMARTMQPSDANSFGNVHGGAIMYLVDEAGGAVAIRHSRSRCVTVAMDSMVFKEPVYIGDLLTVRACLTYVAQARWRWRRRSRPRTCAQARCASGEEPSGLCRD